MKFNAQFILSCQILELMMKEPKETVFRSEDIIAALSKYTTTSYTIQVLQQLRKSGLIKAKRGKVGGYYCPYNSISLYDIVKIPIYYDKNRKNNGYERLQKNNPETYRLIMKAIEARDEALKETFIKRKVTIRKPINKGVTK